VRWNKRAAVRPRAAHFRALFATLLALSSCVLVVSPEDIGDHCTFHGSTACSTCIRSKCQAQVDTCCRDKTCLEQGSPRMMDAIDKCGVGDAFSCATAVRSQQQGSAATLRDCLSRECASECTKLAPDAAIPAAAWKCESPRDPITDCAKCIYDSCGPQIDACCKDTLCTAPYYSEMRMDMGACTTGDQRACAFMAYTKSVDGVDGALRACIARTCGESCVGDALPYYQCSLHSAGAYCTCTAAEKPGTTTCTRGSTKGDCVVTDKAKGCVCGGYSCSGTTSGCSCAFDSLGGGTTCKAASGEVCCLDLSGSTVSCRCQSSQCSSGEYSVTSCSYADVKTALEKGKRLVDECSN
jgi:hypothetical protein